MSILKKGSIRGSLQEAEFSSLGIYHVSESTKEIYPFDFGKIAFYDLPLKPRLTMASFTNKVFPLNSA